MAPHPRRFFIFTFIAMRTSNNLVQFGISHGDNKVMTAASSLFDQTPVKFI
jgi:hypothetical protein